MKLAPILACALVMAGCASRQRPVITAEHTPPPSDEMEVILQDHSRVYRAPRPINPAEQDAKLLREMQDENLILRMCGEVNGPTSETCQQLRRELCQVDVFILSDGRWLTKSYCR